MFRKIMLFSLVLVAILLCCRCDINPTLGDYDPKGPTYRTPKGYFTIYAHNYGEVTQEHLEMADRRWEDVTLCLNFDPNRLRNYPMLLEKTPFACGKMDGSAGCHHDYGNDYGGHIAVVGSMNIAGWENTSEVQKRWELERIWGHEMIHQIFVLKYGHNDPDHERESDWECQYPRGESSLTGADYSCII